MPGVIRQILVKPGDKVKRDQPLVVMEAMKLQTTLTAGGDAKVEAVLVKTKARWWPKARNWCGLKGI